MFAETLVFGLANSLHCAGMCGPLAACFVGGGRAGLGAYHAGRAVSYTTVGALLGALGSGVAGGAEPPLQSAWVSFLLAGSMLLFGLGLFRFLGRFPGVAGVTRVWASWSGKLPPARRAAALGLLTPLLPCGLLYAIYAAAFVSGSTAAGAAVMLGFALGSLPALGFAQANLAWLHTKLSPVARVRVQSGVLLVAAGVLAWRGWVHLQGASCCT